MTQHVLFRTQAAAEAALAQCDTALGYPKVHRRGDADFQTIARRLRRLSKTEVASLGYSVVMEDPDGGNWGFVMEPRAWQACVDAGVALPALRERTRPWLGIGGERDIDRSI